MQNLLRNLGISTAAVAGIVFLMMGWRCMIVVAISLPLSACLVICGLRLMSIPIHQMSITGLIVALDGDAAETVTPAQVSIEGAEHVLAFEDMETFAAGLSDAARYADSYGYQSDKLNTQWPYRDWVVQAFNDNLPYDEFLTWQLRDYQNTRRLVLYATDVWLPDIVVINR